MNMAVVSELFITALTSTAVWTMTTAEAVTVKWLIRQRDAASYTGTKAKKAVIIEEEGNEEPMKT